MELKDTVEGMNSKDYKERFKAEYWQLKIRYEKLVHFITKIEAYSMLDWDKAMFKDEPVHDCPINLLRNQEKAMSEYLHTLEIRAQIEEIDLNIE